MRSWIIYSVCAFCLWSVDLTGQHVILEGYVFENDNRGYLNEVKVMIASKENLNDTMEVYSDDEGFFSATIPLNQTFVLTAEKPLFHIGTEEISTFDKGEGDKVFAKITLNRKPGYLFDVTLAEERTNPDSAVAAISGALIEIYNNTTAEEELVLRDYPHPNFSFTFQKGNHYTILIRKPGYFAKRLEAMVDVEGCILCFEGIQSIETVTDNLTVGHQMGTMLANIELKRADVGTTFKVENILYDLDDHHITTSAAAELDKLVQVLLDNPQISVELGSHTDSRGGGDYNFELSEKRARAAVEYLVNEGVSNDKIAAKGYGETQLINRCKDGVKCSEADHRENRRTEIKVTGIVSDDEVQSRSLVDIKREERFEQMLGTLDSEVVEIAPGEELPDEIKRQVSDSLENDDEKLEISLEEEAAKPDKNLLPEDHKVERTIKDVNRTTEHDRKTQMEEKLLRKLDKNPAVSERLKPMPSDFTGFKIQLTILEDDTKVSEYLREISDELGPVWSEKNRHGQLVFLVGNFDEISSALEFFDQHVESVYSEAKIIEYLNGERL